jgi:hypothetical protein
MSANTTYFYRCHSKSSAGSLISGKGRSQGRRLSDSGLGSEFINHTHLQSADPTALISVSSRLIDTIQRAFNKFYEQGECPGQIWIAFIYVPDVHKHVYHHAEYLADKYHLANPSRLQYEYIFEWEIPEEYLIHQVSVETLMACGADMKEFLHFGEGYPCRGALPPTSVLRDEFAAELLESSDDGYAGGIGLGLLARCFGARSPLRQITQQLLRDCIRERFIDNDDQLIRVSYKGNDGTVLDFAHYRVIENGVELGLYDWRLTDSDFFGAYTHTKSSRL